MEKDAGLSDSELVTLCNAEWDEGIGFDGGDIGKERADALDRYLQKPYGDEQKGHSQVVSSEVADVVDGIMPSLLRIFLSGDTLASFAPMGQEDIEAAAQETDYVHHQLFTKNPAFLLFFYWFFDALLQKNGYVKCFWDSSENVSQESYDGLTADALANLSRDEELEPIRFDRRIRKGLDEIVTPEGVQYVEVDETVYDVTFRRITTKGYAAVVNVPPEELRISSDANSLDPSSGRMTCHERAERRADLLAMGFDRETVMDLPKWTGSADGNTEKLARHDKTDDRGKTGDGVPQPDRLQDEVRLREFYLQCDYDGDGRNEIRQVFVGGDSTLLLPKGQSEPKIVDRQPFHALSPCPLPHKHIGRSVADKVVDLQRIGSVLWRQVLDNMYRSNNPMHGVWEAGLSETTLNDLLTSELGATVRFRRPVSEAYAPLTVPFTAANSFPMIEHIEKVKKDRTGISADSEGLSPDQLKHIQQTVMAASMDISKLKQELIARVFAETGIKSLLLHIHELCLKHQNKQEVVELRNEWVPVDPREWRRRSDMKAEVGLGRGSREQNLMHLESLWQKLTAVVQAGGGYNEMVGPPEVYELFAEFCKNAGYKHPERFMKKVGKISDKSGSAETALIQQQLALQKEQTAVETGKLQLKFREQERRFELQTAELRQKAKEHSDKMAYEFEQLKNQLTEFELKYGRNVPGAGV